MISHRAHRATPTVICHLAHRTTLTMICDFPMMVDDHALTDTNHDRKPWFNRCKSSSGEAGPPTIICHLAHRATPTMLYMVGDIVKSWSESRIKTMSKRGRRETWTTVRTSTSRATHLIITTIPIPNQLLRLIKLICHRNQISTKTSSVILSFNLRVGALHPSHAPLSSFKKVALRNLLSLLTCSRMQTTRSAVHCTTNSHHLTIVRTEC